MKTSQVTRAIKDSDGKIRIYFRPMTLADILNLNTGMGKPRDCETSFHVCQKCGQTADRKEG